MLHATPIHFHIIIVNYKNWSDTCECLTALFNSDYPHFSVAVVDNASPNDSRVQLLNWASTQARQHPRFKFKTLTEEELYKNTHLLDDTLLTFIWSEKNEGFAAGNNLVLRKLIAHEQINSNSFAWLLNPDVYVESTTLSAVSARIEKSSTNLTKTIWGILTYDYYNRSHLLHIGGAYVINPLGIVKLVTEPTRELSLQFIVGGCMIASLSAYKEVGVLPESYFLYWEETDWCSMARRSGYTLSSISTTRVYDKVGSSIGRGYLAEYYYTRNALKYAGKNYFYWIPTILMFNSVRAIKRCLEKRWPNARAIIKASFDFMLGRNP